MRKIWLVLVLLGGCKDAKDIEEHLGPGAVCSGDDDIYQCVKDGKPVTCVIGSRGAIACYAGVAPSIKHEDTTVIYSSPPSSN